jgi:GNAT superfamily N-acetyltransferase
MHTKHHQAVTTIPKFKGWATEDFLTINDWSEQGGRIIHLQPNHKNINSEYVKELVTRMETVFGIQDDVEKLHIYLAAYDSKLVGIATVSDLVKATKSDRTKLVSIGVKRLFVRPEFRRKGFAKTMLKTIVMMHQKGELLDLKTDVAFSSPTEDGKKLIESVIGSDNYFTFTS